MVVYAHYDRQADVAWFVFGEPGSLAIEATDEAEWGLVDRDRGGQVVGVELWRASTRLPRALLDALPDPAADSVTVERQTA